MTQSAFDQRPPQRASRTDRIKTTHEAAQRSVERVTEAVDKVFSQVKREHP